MYNYAMRISMLLVYSIIVVTLFGGCTPAPPNANEPIIINLKPNKKLVNVGNDHANFWYLVRNMHSSDEPEVYNLFRLDWHANKQPVEYIIKEHRGPIETQ